MNKKLVVSPGFVQEAPGGQGRRPRIVRPQSGVGPLHPLYVRRPGPPREMRPFTKVSQNRPCL